MIDPHVVALMARTRLEEARADAARVAAVKAARSGPLPRAAARRTARARAGLALIRLGAWLLRSPSLRAARPSPHCST